ELEHLVHELVEGVGHVLALVAVLLALAAQGRDFLTEPLELLLARVQRRAKPFILLDEGRDQPHEVLAILDPLLYLGPRLPPRGPFHVRHRLRLLAFEVRSLHSIWANQAFATALTCFTSVTPASALVMPSWSRVLMPPSLATLRISVARARVWMRRLISAEVTSSSWMAARPR